MSEKKSIITSPHYSLLQFRKLTADYYTKQELASILRIANQYIENRGGVIDNYGFNIIERKSRMASILINELSLDKTTLTSALLYGASGEVEFRSEQLIDKGVWEMIDSLLKIDKLYKKTPIIESENFRKLLLTFAKDIRVIMIMLADRLVLMRMLADYSDDSVRRKIAYEASYLYAPLAHRLGVYKIKTELEDLSLKYTNREIYTQIAKRLKAKKSERESYIQAFIEPIRNKILETTGLTFDIKGRPKSIHSIWNKIRKQEVGIEQIYDLLAIRIIIDASPETEKSACWHVYSLIADMYQPNPKRLRDWLSIPKSNGYESLHTTVLGPDNKWVEIQIRSKRMDDVAERGLAAHWRYKQGKESSGLDQFLDNVRDLLENAEQNSQELIKNFKLQLDNEEIYVFTPKGDLFQLPVGATVLDFAFMIHSNLGCKCVGAKINGKNVTIKQTLSSGDQVEILTASTQSPRQDWLNIVTTQKAKSKIRQTLKEIENKEAEFGKETFMRRMKNRKIDADESILALLIKKQGFKNATHFFSAVANEQLEINQLIDGYTEILKKENHLVESSEQRTADEFVLIQDERNIPKQKSDVLLLDKSVSGIDYRLAKCCNPIYGDNVFAFVSTNGLKIHRVDCPNAPEMISRFGYRIKEVQWTGQSSNFYTINLRVVGNDDISIITNITSLISKEKEISLRSVNIDSNDGLFIGRLTIALKETSTLDSLIRKIGTIKGVKQISRE